MVMQKAVDAMREFEHSRSTNPLRLTLYIHSLKLNADGTANISYRFAKKDSMLIKLLLLPAYLLGVFFCAYDIIDWAERVSQYRRLTPSAQARMCNLIDAHSASMTRRLSALLEGGQWNPLKPTENG